MSNFYIGIFLLILSLIIFIILLTYQSASSVGGLSGFDYIVSSQNSTAQIVTEIIVYILLIIAIYLIASYTQEKKDMFKGPLKIKKLIESVKMDLSDLE